MVNVKVRVPSLAVLLCFTLPVITHEDDGVASDCLTLQGNYEWSIVNACDVTVDMAWCMDYDDRCDWTVNWNTKRGLKAGESVSTGTRTDAPIVTFRVAACASDDLFEGMWRTPDRDNSVVCLAPKSAVNLLTGRYDAEERSFPPDSQSRHGETEPSSTSLLAEAFRDLSVVRGGDDCIEVLNDRGYVATEQGYTEREVTYLRNSCGYTIAVSSCRAVGIEVGGRFACGGAHNPNYYSGLVHLNAFERKVMWEGPIHVAACRVGKGGFAFDPDGWDGEGGFTCLDLRNTIGGVSYSKETEQLSEPNECIEWDTPVPSNDNPSCTYGYRNICDQIVTLAYRNPNWRGGLDYSVLKSEVVTENETVLLISLRCVGPVMLYRTGEAHDQQAKSPTIYPSVQVSSSVGSGERRTDVSRTVITI